MIPVLLCCSSIPRWDMDAEGDEASVEATKPEHSLYEKDTDIEEGEEAVRNCGPP